MTLCVMSAFYLCWAAYKLLAKHDPDLGMVTFLLAFVAAYRTADLCAVQIARAPNRSKDAKPLLKMQVFLPMACFLVMMNYLLVLALIPTLPFTFQVYLCCGAVTWSLAAIRGGWLLGDDSVVSSLKEASPYEMGRKRRTENNSSEREELCRSCRAIPDEEGRA